MSRTPTITDRTTWALDREIVLVRVLEAPREPCSPRGQTQMPSANGSAPKGSPAQSGRWTFARAAERAST